jgi:hypothetical protein
VKTLTVAILAIAVALPALSQDRNSWNNLNTLQRGARVGVVQTNGASLNGRFESFTDSAIVVRAGREITVPKETVVRVFRRPRIGRAVRAAIGGAIGVVAGAILTGTVGDRFRNEGQDVPAGAWICGGAAIGAGIGALAGGGNHTVYQRAP